MSTWEFDRDAELARLKAVAQEMARQLKVDFVINPDKERNFLAAAAQPNQDPETERQAVRAGTSGQLP